MFAIAAWNKVTFLGLPYFLPSVGLETAAVIYSWFREGPTGRLSGVFKVYLLFLYVEAFAALVNLENISATAEIFTKISCHVMVYLLVVRGIREKSDINRSVQLLMYTSFVPLSIGAYEVLSCQNLTAEGGFEQFACSDLRITSTIIDANACGIYLSFTLFGIIPLLIRSRSKEAILCLALVLLSIVYSKNRGTWISLFVALTVTVAVFRQHVRVTKWLGAAAGLALLSLPLMLRRFSELSQRDEWGQSKDTFATRLNYHVQLFERSLDHFLLGSNLGDFSVMGGAELPHNDYVRIAVESGYIALLLYCAFLAAQYVRALRLRSSARWDIQFSAHAMQIYFIMMSYIDNLFADITVYSIFMYLLAVSHKATSFEKA